MARCSPIGLSPQLAPLIASVASSRVAALLPGPMSGRYTLGAPRRHLLSAWRGGGGAASPRAQAPHRMLVAAVKRGGGSKNEEEPSQERTAPSGGIDQCVGWCVGP